MHIHTTTMIVVPVARPIRIRETAPILSTTRAHRNHKVTPIIAPGTAAQKDMMRKNQNNGESLRK
jgi:hypothetical protein